METNQNRTVGEVAAQLIAEANRLGFANSYIWGNLDKGMGHIRNYYRMKGMAYYSVAVTDECIEYHRQRCADKDISASYLKKIESAARRMNAFFCTGTLSITGPGRSLRVALPAFFEHLMDLFLQDIGYGPNTIDDAIWVVRKYLLYFSERGHVTMETVTLEDVREFIMTTALAVKCSTLHDIFLYLRQFHEYLKKAALPAPDAEALFSNTIHREMPVQGYVTSEEIQKVLDILDPNTEVGSRNIAIIQLAMTTGIRACDVIRLKLTDIDWRAGKIKFVQEKTDFPVTLPLLPQAGEAIQHYILNYRPNTGCEEVFLRVAPPKIAMKTADCVGTMFKEYQQRAGVERKAYDGKGFHGIRRNLARGMLATGTPPETIAQILGHTHVESVRQYLVLNMPSLKECAPDFTDIAVERRELL